MEITKMAEVGADRSLKAKMSKLRKRGLSLVEAAAVLAVAAIVVMGALALYNMANQSRLLNQTNTDLNVIQQAVRSMYSGQSSYSGVNSQMLVDTKAVPARMEAGTGLRHAMNGAITLASAPVNGVADAGFQVTFANVPVEACSKLLAADLGRNLWAAGVGTASRTQSTGLPYTPALAAQACGGTGGYRTVVWIFQ